jgi:hypothetical protein
MTLATTILKLWNRRRWLGVGALIAAVAAVGSVVTSHSTVYATASTEMLVDSPNSALTNDSVLLDGYVGRADVFARLMTSNMALQYIGKAAGINGNLIEATGPFEVNGSAQATHPGVAGTNYKLSFVQNPSLPTIDVYAAAPTTSQAVALANAAVTGFATFVNQLNAGNVPQSQRVEIRQLGQATGGMVDPTASKSMAVLAFVGVFAVWCWLVLFVSRFKANLRAAKNGRGHEASAIPLEEPTDELGAHPAAKNHPGVTAPAGARDADPNARLADRLLASPSRSEMGTGGRIFVRR